MRLRFWNNAHVQPVVIHEYCTVADLAQRWGIDSLAEAEAITRLPTFPNPNHVYEDGRGFVPKWNLYRVQDWQDEQAFLAALPGLLKQAKSAKKK